VWLCISCTRCQDKTMTVIVIAQQCKVFKSVRSPVRFAFRTRLAPGSNAAGPLEGGGRAGLAAEKLVQLLYKEGDDLRQDQFVCQVLCFHACFWAHTFLAATRPSARVGRRGQNGIAGSQPQAASEHTQPILHVM
jgi:hypothetical protein